jgi:NosR/NirI family nitrous oxide reductase transcriptional regulator
MRPRTILAFCCGLFGLGGPALLLAECLVTVAGGEIWIGSLMGAWFLAAAVGSLVARRTRWEASRSIDAAQVLSLASIPVLCAQYLGIVLLGGRSDAILPMHQILRWSVWIAGPGGLLSGFLLAILCRRNREGTSPVGGVCIGAAVGGIVGGTSASFLLHQGLSAPAILLWGATVVCLAVTAAAWTRPRRRLRWVGAAYLAFLLIAVVLRVDIPATQAVHERLWSQAVPGAAIGGSFRTAQAEYLHGTDGDRWVVVREGGVHDVVGDRTQAGKIAAMALSQNFTAERVLVIGQGLSICERFLKSPNVKGVDWLDPDPGYVRTLQACLPEALRISDPRFHWLAADVRASLADKAGSYDVVVVNLPRVVDSRLHEFATVEFFEQIKQSLRPLGLVVVGIVGDRNKPRGEPGCQGAWVENTLDAVFPQTLVVPDEQRTFFVSAAEAYLQVSPISLQTRFGLIENADEIYPVESVEHVYRPDLSVKMLELYDAVDVPRERLVNRDRSPSHQLAGLLQTTSRSGMPLGKPAQALFRGGLTILILPIVLLAIVRLVYMIRTAPRAQGGPGLHDSPSLQSDVLLFSGSAAGAAIAGLISLADAGTRIVAFRPSDIGFMFSLFTLGLALGATCARWAVSLLRPSGPMPLRSVLWAFAAILLIQGAVLAVSSFVLAQSATWPVLGMLVATCGFPCGAVGILTAKILEACSHDADSSAYQVAADCLGAAVGCLAGSFLASVVGLGAAISVAAAVVFAAVLLAMGAQFTLMRPGRRIVPHRTLTPVAYGLFGVAACVVAGSHVLAHVERSRATAQATVAIQDWIQGRKISPKTTTPAAGGKAATYHEVREESQLKGYIFRSDDFSTTVYGYGGPMSVILFADPAGALIDFRITRSYETPRYISRIRSWMASLKGHKVFGPSPLQGVNAVSGATMSCNAILRLLRNSGGQFDASVLAGVQTADVSQRRWIEKVDWLVVYWAAGVVLTLVVIHHGRLWSRIAMLVFTAAVGGVWLNRQYSTDHVIRLLSGQGLLGSPLANACLLLGIPLVVLLLGNVYCGYLCPFGAVQELLGFVLPKRFKAKPSLPTMTAARFVKYGVLFSLVIILFATGSKRLFALDPLTTVFNRQFWTESVSAGLILVILVLLAAPFVTRIWCRYLCPTGAFLSLFNLAGWLGCFLPAKKFGRCEFGLGGRDHLDCIHCDRCRYESRIIPSRSEAFAKVADAPPAGCEST